MVEAPVKTSDAPRGWASELVRCILVGLDGPRAEPVAWNLVRALLFFGFVVFAATTSLAWLRLNVATPHKNEPIDLLGAIAVSPAENDTALVRRWLPAEGKVGYLTDKRESERIITRLRLAPILLDYDWRKHDLVVVDYPVGKGMEVLDTPRYKLLANLTEAKAFAKGMRIYKRLP